MATVTKSLFEKDLLGLIVPEHNSPDPYFSAVAKSQSVVVGDLSFEWMIPSVARSAQDFRSVASVIPKCSASSFVVAGPCKCI